MTVGGKSVVMDKLSFPFEFKNASDGTQPYPMTGNASFEVTLEVSLGGIPMDVLRLLPDYQNVVRLPSSAVQFRGTLAHSVRPKPVGVVLCVYDNQNGHGIVSLVKQGPYGLVVAQSYYSDPLDAHTPVLFFGNVSTWYFHLEDGELRSLLDDDPLIAESLDPVRTMAALF